MVGGAGERRGGQRRARARSDRTWPEVKAYSVAGHLRTGENFLLPSCHLLGRACHSDQNTVSVKRPNSRPTERKGVVRGRDGRSAPKPHRDSRFGSAAGVCSPVCVETSETAGAAETMASLITTRGLRGWLDGYDGIDILRAARGRHRRQAVGTCGIDAPAGAGCPGSRGRTTT